MDVCRAAGCARRSFRAEDDVPAGSARAHESVPPSRRRQDDQSHLLGSSHHERKQEGTVEQDGCRSASAFAASATAERARALLPLGACVRGRIEAHTIRVEGGAAARPRGLARVLCPVAETQRRATREVALGTRRPIGARTVLCRTGAGGNTAARSGDGDGHLHRVTGQRGLKHLRCRTKHRLDGRRG